MKKLSNIWKNKWKILQGIRYTWFPNKYVEKIAEIRTKVCESNQCGFYNKAGDLPIVVVKGSPSCGQCGCRISYKSRSLSAWCSLKEEGKYPLWDAELTEEQEKKFRLKTGIKNE